MIINSTISVLHHHHQIDTIDKPADIEDLTPKHYDSAGAALFIIIVLFWYSTGIVCMLGMQIRARSETIEDCARRRAKLFIQSFRDQTQTKQILEELADKQKRDKLWDIYLGKTDNNKDKLHRDETLRIKNIKKQIAVINRNHMIMNDKLISPIVNPCVRRTSFDSRSTFNANLSVTENQSRIRRRSSFDQQIIERWKLLADQTKAHEQLPWTLRKMLIHRHFRRHCKNLSKEYQPKPASMTDLSTNYEHSESIDDEQCHLLPTNKPRNSNLREIKRNINDRSNPYITYFHLPVNENSGSDFQHLPLVAIKSDHHIIQIDHDEFQS